MPNIPLIISLHLERLQIGLLKLDFIKENLVYYTIDTNNKVKYKQCPNQFDVNENFFFIRNKAHLE